MSKSTSPYYGQVVVGPPGSGKTTFCNGMQQYLRLLNRDAWVVNMDPANETTPTKNDDCESHDNYSSLPYDTLFDVCEQVVNLSSVSEQTGLGPNGGLVYCMEYIEAHMDEIICKLHELLQPNMYLLFDFPGQVELYTHSTCAQSIVHKLAAAFDLRLTAVQLLDAHYCTDASKFLSAALLGTTTMLRLELPTVSVLSKADLLCNYGELPMQFEFFTECLELDRLLPFLSEGSYSAATSLDYYDIEDAISNDVEYKAARRKRRGSKFSRKFMKLHEALAEVTQDFGLLSFAPLDISCPESVGRALARIDKCNGYAFVDHRSVINADLFQCAIQSEPAFECYADVRERIAAPESIEELL
jgi:GTPase SAR1 family protein